MPPKITDPIELANLKRRFAADPLVIHLTPGNLRYLALGRRLELAEMLAPLIQKPHPDSGTEELP